MTEISDCLYPPKVKVVLWSREKIEEIYPNLRGDTEGLRRLYVQGAEVFENAVIASARIDTSLPEVRGRNRPHVNIFIYMGR